MATYFREIVNKVTIWQVRMIALGMLVVCIGGTSQVLVNAFAAQTEQVVSHTAHTVAIKASNNKVNTNCPIVMRTSPTGIIIAANKQGHTLFLQCPAAKRMPVQQTK